VGCAACNRDGNDPTGVWGLWKIAPNKKQWHPRAGGFCALLLRQASFFFFLREPPASVKQPGREKPEGRPGTSPASISGAVAEPAGEQKQKAASGLAVTRFYQRVADRTEKAAVRKNEERKKHDRLSPLLPAGRKRFFIALKNNSTHKNVLIGLAWFFADE